MPRLSKNGKVVSQSRRTNKVCPKCDHDDFKVTETKLSWLLGEKFKCSKCGATFKEPKTLSVYERSREFHVKQTGTIHKTKLRRQKHR